MNIINLTSVHNTRLLKYIVYFFQNMLYETSEVKCSVIRCVPDQGKEIEENNKMGNTRDLFKKIRDIKETFHEKIGTIKDRKDMDGSSWHCTGGSDQDHPQEKEIQKAKSLSEEALQIAVKRRQFSSVAQSCPTLRPHELQHTRPPCPSPTPRVHPNSCPLSRWCHPAISSSVIPFSSCPQIPPSIRVFPMSQLFT